MCWSGEASTVLATIGLSTAAYSAYKKEPPVLWACLGYFALMELLQAFTYSVIDQCGMASNQIATLLGYIHVAFQPFFVNALSMYFIPDHVRKRIEIPVYILCFFSTIFMWIQVYPFEWAGACKQGLTFCGPKLCSVSGNWHIAWEVPANGIGGNIAHFTNYILAFPFKDGFPTYAFTAFILPLLYGSWRMTVFHLVLGPILAGMLTTNPNEHPAIWCLLSIGILLIVVKTPLRTWLRVERWPLWPKAKVALEPAPLEAEPALKSDINEILD